MVYCAQLPGGGDVTLGGLADLLPRTDGDDTTAAGLAATLMDAAYAGRSRVPDRAFGSSRDRWITLADRIEPAFEPQPLPGDPGWSWMTGEAMLLLQLLMYAAAHDRDQHPGAVPWSAGRLQLQLGPAGLRDYLSTALASLGHPDPTARGVDTDHTAMIWAQFQDPAWNQKMHKIDDPLPELLPYLTKQLDRVLIAERGGFAPDTDVRVTPADGGPWPARIVAPVWRHAIPPGEPAARIDLTDGPPTAYVVIDPATGRTTQTDHDTITPAATER
ncbi:MAG TPA: hypothetical protein VGL46_15020 [Pseudonocardiaceae bacterium]|jgi:hypothetical protein